jgi:hypothetical protein
VQVLAAILVCNAYYTLLINYGTEITQQLLWQIIPVLAEYHTVMTIDQELSLTSSTLIPDAATD